MSSTWASLWISAERHIPEHFDKFRSPFNSSHGYKTRNGYLPRLPNVKTGEDVMGVSSLKICYNYYYYIILKKWPSCLMDNLSDRLNWFLWKGGLKWNFYPNRFFNFRFLYAGFYRNTLRGARDIFKETGAVGRDGTGLTRIASLWTSVIPRRAVFSRCPYRYWDYPVDVRHCFGQIALNHVLWI